MGSIKGFYASRSVTVVFILFNNFFLYFWIIYININFLLLKYEYYIAGEVVFADVLMQPNGMSKVVNNYRLFLNKYNIIKFDYYLIFIGLWVSL
jgi:hypothetical protein